MELDHYQQAIVDHISMSGPSLVIDAKAGSGKSTTIAASFGVLPAGGSVKALAFNRTVDATMREKAEQARRNNPAIPYLDVSTFNSAGAAILRQWKPGKFQIDKWKSMNIMRDLGIKIEDKFLRRNVESLVGLLKANSVRPAEAGNSVEALVTHMGFCPSDNDRKLITSAAVAILCQGHDNALSRGQIDFDDQLYLPVLEVPPTSIPQYSHIFVDEAQDMSPVQVDFIARMLSGSGRVTAVGDRHQAIYGFRGADANCIDSVTTRFQCSTLPLNVCYRCPTSVVELARGIVPELEARPGAPVGEIHEPTSATPIEQFAHNDLVLCRNNGPLISLACKFLDKGEIFRLTGPQLIDTLNYYVDRVNTAAGYDKKGEVPIAVFTSAATEFFAEEVEKFEARGAWGMVDSLQDYREALSALCLTSSVYDSGDLRGAINALFKGQAGPILSTVHRAKGMEAERVWILSPDLMPSKRAKPGTWQYTQELNLQYIAYTRAMRELIFLNGGVQ